MSPEETAVRIDITQDLQVQTKILCGGFHHHKFHHQKYQILKVFLKLYCSALTKLNTKIGLHTTTHHKLFGQFQA